MIEFRFHHLDIPVVPLSKSYFTHKREAFSNRINKMWSDQTISRQNKQTHEKQNTQTSFYACTWSSCALRSPHVCAVYQVAMEWKEESITRHPVPVPWTYTFRAPLFITDVL